MKTTRTLVFLLAAALLSGCASSAETQDVGTPDTLWQQANVVKEGKPWVVGVGDSFMSGEAGRWASNGTDNASFGQNGGWLLGTIEEVYGDGVDYTESIPACHRSATAPMFVGGDVNHANLACSGAMTESFVNDFGNAKPGLDFTATTTGDGQVVEGQATQLQEFAATREVSTVVMSIGGNDMGFADIISQCVSGWVSGKPCRDSDFIASRVNPAVKKVITARVVRAIENVNAAMTRAGKAPSSWRLLVQLPPSPVPSSNEIDVDDSAFNRQAVGGCGMLDADLDFANEKLLPYLDEIIGDAVRTSRKSASNAAVTVVDMEKALDGHRLCEKGTQRPPAGIGIPPDEFGQGVEWVRFISVVAAEVVPDSPETQEILHPNYFGQRALASCMTLARETAVTTREVSCRPGSPLTFGEQALPSMELDSK